MNQRTAKIIDEILSLSTYDESTKTYHLSNEAAKILSSNQYQKNIIKNIFNELGINIEYSNKVLPKIKGVELFSKYNEIKYKLEYLDDLENKNELEILRIEIRNKIAELNFELIKTVINRRYNKINLDLPKYFIELDDLYQIGYELLINYIDKHYLEKDKMFNELTSLLMLHIETNLFTELYSSSYSKTELIRLQNILKLKDNINIKELAIELNIKEEKLIELLNLYNIINSISIDEIDIKSIKIDEQETIEELIIKKQEQIYLERIIDTIQNNIPKRVMILLYGLNGEEIHTYKETADELGCSEKSIDEKRKIAMTQLIHPMRMKYIKDILGPNIKPNLKCHQTTNDELNSLKKLELFLIKELDINHLMFLIDKLNPQFKESLLIYLGYQEKNEHYYKNGSSYSLEKEYALTYLRNRITELYINDSKNEELKDYFDYLMYYYLNKPLTKRRIK